MITTKPSTYAQGFEDGLMEKDRQLQSIIERQKRQMSELLSSLNATLEQLNTARSIIDYMLAPTVAHAITS